MRIIEIDIPEKVIDEFDGTLLTTFDSDNRDYLDHQTYLLYPEFKNHGLCYLVRKRNGKIID